MLKLNIICITFAFLQGHFVRALGEIGTQNTENEVVLLEHDVPHNQFSEEVLSCLPKLPWIITDEVIIYIVFVLNILLLSCH